MEHQGYSLPIQSRNRGWILQQPMVVPPAGGWASPTEWLQFRGSLIPVAEALAEWSGGVETLPPAATDEVSIDGPHVADEVPMPPPGGLETPPPVAAPVTPVVNSEAGTQSAAAPPSPLLPMPPPVGEAEDPSPLPVLPLPSPLVDEAPPAPFVLPPPVGVQAATAQAATAGSGG